ncbi:MAG: AMP-binding protein [Rhodoferax sp.]|jgi:acyl-CoA synthetase (AMP-forming)/AMP-acid ligase II
MNVGLAVTRITQRAPRSLALFDGERTMDYATLDARSNRLAHLLRAQHGFAKGDRVALLVHNRMEVVEVLVGASKAAMVYVGLNFRMTEAELVAVLANAEPRMLITEPEFAELAGRLAAARGIPLLVLDAGGSYDAALAGAPATPAPWAHTAFPQDEFAIVYTSGTTGLPKGILFEHAAALQHGTVACLEYEITEHTRYLIQIPHNSCVNITMVPCLMAGAAIGFAESRGFSGPALCDTVERHQVTHTFLVPTMLATLLEQDPGDFPRRLASITTLGYGSSPIPTERLRTLVAKYGPIFIQLYGMAEIASIGTLLRKQDHVQALADKPQLLASCGRPSFATTVRLVTPEGADVPPGETGEIIFGGPHTMRAYFREPDRTAKALIGGWLHSGDVGRVDDEGYFYIVDRIKDLIIRGGYNLAPSEVEKVLYTHPAVLDAAVVGIPDEKWGEAVLAVVAFKPGRSATPEELLQLCRSSSLSSIKQPERVEIVDSMPRNTIGKIDKKAVRERYWVGRRKV